MPHLLPVVQLVQEDIPPDVQKKQKKNAYLRLSTTSIVFIFFLIVLCMFLVYVDKDNLFVLPPLLLAPTLTLYFVWWHSHRHAATLDTVLKIFAGGFVPGALAAFVLETSLTILFALICFSDQIPAVLATVRSHLNAAETGKEELSVVPDDGQPALTNILLSSIHKSFGFYVFLFLMAYIVAACVEETIKWGVVRCRCMSNEICCDSLSKSIDHPHSIIVYILAGALGFSTIENILYTCGSHLMVDDLTIWDKVLNCLERVLFAVPVHSICAGLTGVQLMRRELVSNLNWTMVLIPAILVHGTFNFQSFLVAAVVESEMAQLLLTSFNCGVVLVTSWWYLWYNIHHFRLDILDLVAKSKTSDQIEIEDGIVLSASCKAKDKEDAMPGIIFSEILSYTDKQNVSEGAKTITKTGKRSHGKVSKIPKVQTATTPP